jgi:hypothetical protein
MIMTTFSIMTLSVIICSTTIKIMWHRANQYNETLQSVFMLSVFYAEFFYAECLLCWVSFMLSVFCAECLLCWVSFMLSVFYAECLLCWVSFMLSVFHAECRLCWLSFMLRAVNKSFMLSVVRLNFVMVSVMVPYKKRMLRGKSDQISPTFDQSFI